MTPGVRKDALRLSQEVFRGRAFVAPDTQGFGLPHRARCPVSSCGLPGATADIRLLNPKPSIFPRPYFPARSPRGGGDHYHRKRGESQPCRT